MAIMARIAVLGAAAVDTIVKVEQFPAADEIVFPQSIDKYPGGSTANVAVGLKRLGLEASFLGKAGGDTEGFIIKEDFDREGVDTSYLIIEKEASSAQTFIAVNSQGERVIYSLGGTALYERDDEISQMDFSGFDGLYIGEVLENVAPAAVRRARQCGIPIFYSPGGLFCSLGLERIGYLVANCDYLLVNLPELKLLAGKDQKETAVRELLNYGVRNLIVTEGTLGSGFYSGECRYFADAFKVQAIDSTGAGDSFTAGFIKGVFSGLTAEQSLKLGNACAACTVTKMGARTAMPRSSEVSKFIG